MKFIGVSTPAWSIRGGPQKPKWGEEQPIITDPTPGPAHHKREDIIKGTEKILPKAPEWPFSKAAKKDFFGKPPAVPGPGKYLPPAEDPKPEPSTKIHKQEDEKPFITKANRFRSKRGLNPVGPADYNDQYKKKNPPHFSFGYKFDSGYPGSESLGPGQYNPSFTQQEFSKGFKIKKPVGGRKNTTGSKKRSKSSQLQSGTPGPGHYRPLYPMERNTIMRTTGTFGRAKRNDIYKGLIGRSPGPPAPEDEYFQSQALKKLEARSKRRGNDNLKGAGHGLQVPGPGTYNISGKLGRGGNKFGRGPRPPLNPKACYKPASDQEAFKILNKGDEDSEEVGRMVNTTGVFFEHKKIYPSFGKGQKGTAVLEEETDIERQVPPGPGHYIERPFEYKKPSNKKQEEKGGLAKYPVYRTAPRFTLQGRRTRASNNALRNPGPGAYREDIFDDWLEISKAVPKSFGRDRKFRTTQKSEKKVRGVQWGEKGLMGDMRANAYKFGKAKKMGPSAQVDPDIEVGPGSYDIKSTVPQLQCFERMRMRGIGFELIEE